MICSFPWMRRGMAYACGQCMPCRINHKRVWMHRMKLEALQYADNCFATLTYSDVEIPKDHSLRPEDMTLWLKRLRKAWEPRQFRYFYVGEYGEQTFRPHYHAILFNFPGCARGRSNFSSRRDSCCGPCDLVKRTWGKGRIELGPGNKDTIDYVCGYVTKKMTKATDERLGGRHPEFARMSRRPALGTDALWEVADVLLTHDLQKVLPDVPTTLRHGKGVLPLGRTLTRKLRTYVGKEANAPEATIEAQKARLQNVRDDAEMATMEPGMSRFRDWFMREHLISENAGRRSSAEARHKLFRKRKHL